MKNLYVTLIIAACLSSCVTTTIPQLVIPESRTQFDGGIGWNNVGGQVNMQGTFFSHLVLGGAATWNFGPGPVRYAEARLGTVLPGHADMLTLAYGKGKCDLFLSFPAGGPDSDNMPDNYYADFHKLALAWNHEFKREKWSWGTLLNLAHYWGQEMFTFNHFGGHRDRPFQGPFRAEALVYFRLGQKRNLNVALGLTAGSKMRDQLNTDVPVFTTTPMFIGLGYAFSVKGKS